MRLLSAALVALALVVPTAPAAAIYMPPDLVQIPAERLVANLTRQLDALAADSPERPRLEIALARLHAAAWARRAAVLPATSPLHIGIGEPRIVSGPLTMRVLQRALYELEDRGRSVFARLTTAGPDDAAAGCDSAKVADRLDYEGTVVLELTLEPTPDAPKSWTRPAAVRVVSQDLGDDNVGACLAQRVRALDRMPPVPSTVVARLMFGFGAGHYPLAPFYGFGDSHVPPRVSDGPVDAAAEAHLKAAQAHYRRAIAAAPEQALPRLGLAWVLEMGGDEAAAVTAYRDAFARGWAKEKDLRSLGLGQQPIAAEAAYALLRLLPADEAHADERAKLKAGAKKVSGLPRPVTPIVVPLGASDTLAACVDAGAGVAFDLDGSGVVRPWGWLRPGAAWLVYDEGGTGEVRSGLQLFGGVSFWSFWRDGFEALAALDDDGDGWIRGDERRGLALWEDRDGDGVSDPGEVESVDAHGVVALSTRATAGADGVLTSAVTFADGRVRPTWDWVSPGSPTTP